MSNVINLDKVRRQRHITSDPLVSMMQHYGWELTRDNYLCLAYPDGAPEWTDELESMLPAWAQQG
jgi:hypothetical protein